MARRARTEAVGATDASDPDRLLDALLDALAEVDAGDAPARATSLRIPEPVHRAVQLATELGMDGSMTAATTAALLDRVEAFARQRALALHLAAHPEDEPALADVAARRVSGTGHPAVRRPDLVVRVADAVARRDPTWAREGRVDATIDRVLDLVELIDDVERSAVGSSGSA